MKYRYPKDFAALKGSSEHEEGKKGRNKQESLTTAVFINLSHNFDISASIDAEFDRSLFTMGLTEVLKTDERSLSWSEAKNHDLLYSTESSALQSPLMFKSNNDHFKTIKRELVADGVESTGPERKHALTFVNREPGMLHLINPDHNSEGCLYANVKISIKAV